MQLAMQLYNSYMSLSFWLLEIENALKHYKHRLWTNALNDLCKKHNSHVPANGSVFQASFFPSILASFLIF